MFSTAPCSQTSSMRKNHRKMYRMNGRERGRRGKDENK
jgi:hypothetical protein